MSPESIAAEFDVPGKVASVTPVLSGNINKSYRVRKETDNGEVEFFLQRINARVFPCPGLVVSNTMAVARYMQEKLERGSSGQADRWQVSTVIPTTSRAECYIDGRGEFWRAMTLVSGATAHERVLNREHACEAGKVLGWFHAMIADFPVGNLVDTLPGFHITPEYLARHDEILQSVGARERLEKSPEARELAAFIEERRDLAGILEGARERGELQLRPIHGDPKINNIMIDDATGKGIAIVDTDTVKPGLIHYDFGDCVRSACNPAGEETKDPAEVSFDLPAFESLCAGYLSHAGSFLTEADRHYLYDSIRIIAFELGLRFFTDHLAGDVYFKSDYAGHNLNRARVQFRLCAAIEACESGIRKALDKASGN